MERKELFKKTMDALWKAYTSKHLIHGDPCGCAVGNLVCNAMNQQNFLLRKPIILGGHIAWTDVIGFHIDDQCHMDAAAKRQVKSTGYSPEEISMIEHAFEFRNEDGSSAFEFDGSRKDKSGKLGFINVLKTLGKIHKAPEVAKCLIEHVKKGTYTYETEAFKNFYKPKKVKTKFGEISVVK